MTFEDFCLAAQGMNEHENLLQQAEWERTRWLAAIVLMPHSKKGQKIKPQDIAIFPWEKKRKSKRDQQLLKNILKGHDDGNA